MTSRFSFLAPILLTALLAVEGRAVELRVIGDSADPGARTAVRVSIDSTDAPLGALVFSVGFDGAKLRFDGSAKTGNQLANVSVDAPAGYTASSAVLPGAGGDTIAVSLVRSGVSAPLAHGEVRLYFDTWADATGTAWVGVLSDASAASTLGDLIPVRAVDGAVTINTPEAELQVSPSSLDFQGASPDESRDIQIGNGGRGLLTVVDLVLSGTGYLVDSPSLPFDLAPGAVAVVSVRARDMEPGDAVLRISASTPQPVQSDVRLSASGSESTDETETVVRWILPLPEGTSQSLLVLHDPEQPAVVRYVSPGGTESLVRLRKGATHVVPMESDARWMEVASSSRTLKSSTVVTARGWQSDAIPFTDLPTSLAAFTGLSGSDSRLLIANPNDSPIEIEITLLRDDGEEIRRTSRLIRARGSDVVALDWPDDRRVMTVSLRQNNSSLPFAAWSITGTDVLRVRPAP